MPLTCDPRPWLMEEDSPAAVRARRRLGLWREGDHPIVRATLRRHVRCQCSDGSFAGSVMRTAGVLCLLADLRPEGGASVTDAAAGYLLKVLRSQPGYARAKRIRPGGLREPCDLCGFFPPQPGGRSDPTGLVHGAREMNAYREYEPLLGPQSPVRDRPRSSFDRPGPGSCYAWGLIPLAHTIEALCRSGHGHDRALKPAVNALLGAQRDSGGWCRNLGGHPSCSIHGLRALSAHPVLRNSLYMARALTMMRAHLGGRRLFAVIEAASASDLPEADAAIRDGLVAVAPTQRKNGSFGTPHPVERVAAVIAGMRRIA